MNKNILTGLLFFSSFIINAQNVLFSIEGNPAFEDEFLYVYKKNAFNNENAFTKEDVEEYLELYKNFKLKIHEAKQLKLDTITELKNEFETYREQLGKPYLTNDKIRESLVQEAYNRYKYEVNAAHILITLPPNATPQDTLTAWNKIIEIRKKAQEGDDFGKLAAEFSEDPSAKHNKGNLGYFTSMQMVYPFENAAYMTDVGDISTPVRTQFGYHIIKVMDKIPSRGKVKVSHILLRAKSDSIDNHLKNRIYEVFDRIQAGLKWDEAVNLFTEDYSTKEKAGLIDRAFSPSQLPPEFSAAAFSLSQPGEISDPIKTQYGWHIIRLEDKIGIETFEEMEPIIKRRISSGQRADIEKNTVVARLKKENNFIENKKIMERVLTGDSASITNIETEVLFTIQDEGYTVGKYLEHMGNNPGSEINNSSLDSFSHDMLFEYEEEHLTSKYPEYKHLVNEYWEGILLFKLMDDLVWGKASRDSIGLSEFYLENIEDYQWKKRLVGKIYSTSDSSVKFTLKRFIESNTTDRDIRKMLTSETALKIDSGAFEQKDLRFLDKLEWKVGIQEFNEGNIYYLAAIERILEPGPKKLEECKGLVISDYQDKLDNDLITKLRSKYSLKVNKKALKNVYGELVH